MTAACSFQEGRRLIEAYAALGRPFLAHINLDERGLADHTIVVWTDDWAREFAYSRLVEGDPDYPPCESPPPVHRVPPPHDFGLRVNCPWFYKPA
ncbi:MAG: hypothetical protein JXR37_19185 [Kiritimatiellae bacterium]|nr:hypothetical protein [Kiritimatiellia bacterium]